MRLDMRNEAGPSLYLHLRTSKTELPVFEEVCALQVLGREFELEPLSLQVILLSSVLEQLYANISFVM